MIKYVKHVVNENLIPPSHFSPLPIGNDESNQEAESDIRSLIAYMEVVHEGRVNNDFIPLNLFINE